MSDFNYTPSYGLQADYKPAVRVTRFGDGYEQRVGEGINLVPQNWKLGFDNIDIATANAIVAFLVGKAGLTAFTWTPKGGTQIKVVCRSWTATYINVASRSVSCLFEQVFE
ncbi:phage tail protein [Sulfuriferula sp.]|uniref:phage tail protein n=1 Tax=Sulfuriferula sp. TaxID=2025307 RepID=UPI0027308A9E|nr:phage tail protein [Sulfuriferula sp.]MDP2026453.1 phage tail protein [Sulfuriferula sp.]